MKKTLSEMNYREVFKSLDNHLCMYICTFGDSYGNTYVVYDFKLKRLCEWFNIEFKYEIIKAEVDFYDMKVEIKN